MEFLVILALNLHIVLSQYKLKWGWLYQFSTNFHKLFLEKHNFNIVPLFINLEPYYEYNDIIKLFILIGLWLFPVV